MASEVEVAWLAGILEGEGSFMMAPNRVSGKTYYYPKVTVNMTDRDVIERVATLFGTGVYDIPQRAGRLQSHRASVSGVRAAEWMQRLLPHMASRRSDKIHEVLNAYGAIESTEVRRRRSCQEAAKGRPRANGKFACE